MLGLPSPKSNAAGTSVLAAPAVMADSVSWPGQSERHSADTVPVTVRDYFQGPDSLLMGAPLDTKYAGSTNICCKSFLTYDYFYF